MQRLVRPVAVVVPRVLGQELAEMLLAGDQHMIEALPRSVPANRSAYEFARGARTGVLITLVAFTAKASSNAAVNLLSRAIRRSSGRRQLPLA